MQATKFASGDLLEAFLQFEDISSDPAIFQASKLPVDENGKFLPRYMASVGNGHIATNIYTDTVFMNGVYNGFKGESHRARIPSKNNIRVAPAAGANSANQTFSLDIQKGVFTEKFYANGYQVEARVFAHRFYHTLIVNQIEVTSLNTDSESPLVLELKSSSGPPSDDFNFEPEMKYESEYDAITQCGRTKEVEDSYYQAETRLLCTISSKLPLEIRVTNGITYTFFTSYDNTFKSAAENFDAVAELVSAGMHQQVLESHTSQWEQLWTSGRIEVEDNAPLAKVINGSLYYILSSLPITESTNTAVGQFYGLSPGSLANGGHLSDYQGHSFWDTEIWIYPVVLYFFPEAAREVLNYRLHLIQAARDRAKETGFKGVRFPWESCFTGREVTPECCPETRDFQIHNTADIAFAIKQYIALTRDIDWLVNIQPAYDSNGFGLAREIAEFWISKSSYDSQANQHDIRHVMPPDDDHSDKDNSVYTNVIAAYSIFFAKYAECLISLGSKEDLKPQVPDKWIEIAKSLKLIHDPVLNYHPEYEGYPVGELIKQADAILLGFPLMYPMDPIERRNDLLLYGNVTRRNGPAMTWAMHTVGFLELDDLTTAEELFNRSYQPYVREPFKIWTESQPPTLGAVNFLTGMGGFLQEIVSGYGGLRLKQEKIVFTKPRLLPHTKRLKFVGLKYLQNILDVEIDEKTISITLTFASGKYSLSVEFTNGTVTYFPASRVLTLPSTSDYFEIKGSPTKCPLPLDKINDEFKFNSVQKLQTKSLICFISFIVSTCIFPTLLWVIADGMPR
ncbi:unnamed protein product [Allacma fusca]|uniref:Protein-glucosylgalactosylhydroxylysine glucosidase n=1 Tax=Allacma fusca TaxID=39272 RepID=A0A8J2L831_9HEXA|nr:unnamed protein product [Allacma fusca]